jgi:hypothetical protein
MISLRRALPGLLVLMLVILWPSHAAASSILYSNLTVTGQIGVISHPAITNGPVEAEAADDFVLTSGANITGVSFIGLVPSLTAINLAQLAIEFYRVFPQDSDTVRTPNVPTRVNSPSDVALDDHSFGGGDSVTATVLAPTFTTLNSVQNGGIHPLPNQTTGGNGPVTGEEVLFDFEFGSPIFLPAGHYFFVPQVPLNSGSFYWLSASRPIVSPGTPFTPDLQAWIRDGNLDPDWLRIGTDIVGGQPPPTFNMAFEIRGDAAVPEPASLVLLGSGFVVLARRTRTRVARRTTV